jgi:pSer/pThr/pTyr-binding forkhead associated (FHA) protein
MSESASEREIVIRHLAGSGRAGTACSFVSGIISIGRGEGNDLTFDPLADRQVSARHARISSRGSCLVIADLGSTNGTFVNGIRITAETPIGPRDVIRLGESGPEFVVSMGSDEASMLPGTVVQSGRGYAAPDPPPRPRMPRDAPIRVPIGQPGKPRVGSVTVSASPERRGGRRIVPLLALLMLISGVAYAWIKGHLDELDFAPLARAKERSVYLVMVELTRSDGTAQGVAVGTAWAVGDGLLATNAHVADGLAELVEGSRARVFVRSNTSEILDLAIESWEVHPGYAMFQDWMRTSASARVARDGPLPNPFDVALLRLKSEHAGLLERPLPIASDSVLHRLKAGADLTTVGFPTEGLAGGGTDTSRPVASFRRGPLVMMVDAFLGQSDPIEGFTLSYQFEVTGGASGSPVFDARGRVVGLIASGNVVAKTDRGRISVGGTSHGPRGDILRELIDGTASAKMSRREADWRRRFEQWGKG